MQASLLRFYVHENQRCHARLLWEWMLAEANRLGLRGGSAFRAMAGFGRHHHVHEERFFELAGTQTVEVEFVVTDDEAEQLLALVTGEKLRVVYTRVLVELGVLNPDANTAP